MLHCTFTGPNYTCNRKAEKMGIPSMTKAVSLLLNQMDLGKL